MVRELFFVAVLATATMAAAGASAQHLTVCGERDELAGRLAADHSETQTAIGLTADGRLIEVFASPSGTWTMLLTRPDGRACVVSHGEGWTTTPVRVAGPVT